MKAVFVLSIVVPVSLLTGFKLTGLLPEPRKPEIFVVEATELGFQRPPLNAISLQINRTVDNFYKDEGVWAVIDIYVLRFFENEGPPFGSTADLFNMNVTVKAGSRNGVIESINVVFIDESQYARVNIPDPTAPGYAPAYITSSVSVTDWSDYIHKRWELSNSTKATIHADAVGTPSDVKFRLPVYWILGAEDEETWQIEIVPEITYRTSSLYRTLVLPIRLTCSRAA